MSWYVSDGKNIIGQFASGEGYSDLIKFGDSVKIAALTSFFDLGETTDTDAVVNALLLIYKKAPRHIGETATTLASKIKGLPLARVTQGFS